MQTILFSVFSLVIFMTSCYDDPPHVTDPVHKTLFVIVDGIPEDVIQKVETPNLDEIKVNGAFLPTGKDLRGKEWERFNEITGSIDRMIIIPIMNPDGRNRVPIRMSPFRDMNYEVIEYWNTGGQSDGTITGWPDVKKHIPFDFKTPDFPGGYSNEAGVNIQHDDFMGEVQPETRILFDVTSREKPDIILNMHTGAVFPKIHRTFMEDDLNPIFDGIYTEILTGWTLAGFERTDDLDKETDPQHAINSPYNLNSALSFH